MGEEGDTESIAEIKRTMEQDCEKMRLNLEDLMSDRASLILEFKHLYRLQRDMLVQLKGDTLAGEGQLHAFQVEKKRVEDRLDQLEKQLEEKNLAIAELDAKASEYLLKVTTASNSIYDDDDDNGDENQEDQELIKQLVYDEMVENEELIRDENSTASSEEVGERSNPEGDSKYKSFSPEADTSEICDDTSLSFDKSNAVDHLSLEDDIPFDPPIPLLPLSPNQLENDENPPPHTQIAALTGLLDELKGVKEELGRFVSLKDSSMVEIEQELQDTKSELTLLKDSMQNLVKEISITGRESPLVGKRDVDFKRSLPDISELHEIKEMYSGILEDKKELVDQMGTLKNTMNEMQQSKSLEKRSQSHSGELHLASFLNPTHARRSSSTCSISGKVAQLEKELADANDKLNDSALHMKLLVTEREHKQRECELLQKKVTTVESKMHELQVTFDTLMSSIMTERDELVKELKGKEEAIAAAQEAETYRNSALQAQAMLDSLKTRLEASQAEHTKAMKILENERDSISNDRDHLIQLHQEWIQKESALFTQEQMDEIKSDLSKKDELVRNLQEKIYNFEMERADFASVLKGEMERLKEETNKAKEDKQNVEDVFNTLQGEQNELQEKHNRLLDRFNALTKENNKKTGSLETMKKDLEAMEAKVQELSSKNENVSAELEEKDNELQEELEARAATIRELRVTVTNNQKQSKENYQMLQDDMSVLQMRLSKEREEYDAVVTHLKGKCSKLSVDLQQVQHDRDAMKNKLEETEKKLTDAEQTINAAKSSKETEIKEELSQLRSLDNDGMDKNQSESKILDDTPIDSTNTKTNETITDIFMIPSEDESLVSKPYVAEVDGSSKVSESVVATASGTSNETDLKKYISQEELKIEQLETKVHELESIILEKNLFALQLEEKIKDFDKTDAENAESKSRLKTQLEQIEKLNINLDDLKKDLEVVTKERSSLQETVDLLQEQAKSIEEGKESLVKEYEGKLSDMQESLASLEGEAELKKNLVEGLNLKLSTIENRIADDCSSSHSSSSSPCDSFIDRVTNVERFFETKLKETSDNFQSTMNTLGLDLKAVRDENDSYKTKMTESVEMIKNLEEMNSILNKENKKIISDNAEKQDKYIEMQNQMVSDLENLILNLEKDKKNLENEIDSLKKDLTRVADERRKILAALEASLNRIREEKMALQMGEDVDFDQSYIDDSPRESLLEKLNEVTSQLELKEREFEDHIKLNGEAHSAEMKQLRKDMTEEIDILEQQMEEMRQEYEKKIAKLASQYTSEILESQREREELSFIDEKAQFGRVLVAKNDEYEKLKEESQIESEGYQARIQDLQLQLEEKTNLVDELEVNIGELINVRANLEEKLESLKVPKNNPSDEDRRRRSPSNSAGLSVIPAHMLATTVKPPMEN